MSEREDEVQAMLLERIVATTYLKDAVQAVEAWSRFVMTKHKLAMDNNTAEIGESVGELQILQRRVR